MNSVYGGEPGGCVRRIHFPQLTSCQLKGFLENRCFGKFLENFLKNICCGRVFKAKPRNLDLSGNFVKLLILVSFHNIPLPVFRYIWKSRSYRAILTHVLYFINNIFAFNVLIKNVYFSCFQPVHPRYSSVNFFLH